MDEKKKVEKPAEDASRSTREQLARAKSFPFPADAVMAALKGGETYTREQAESLLSAFFKRKA